MRVSLLLGISMTAACYTASAAPLHPTPAAPEPSALVAGAPKPTPVAAGAKQTLWVGGCNTGCIDCSLGSYQSFVVGTLTRTGTQLFPNPDPPAPGYSCGATVAVGDKVTLRAHSPTEHLVIDSWSGFSAGDACPCAGSTAMTCTFTVTPEIASHHDRIYCGATWKQHATAQIGH